MPRDHTNNDGEDRITYPYAIVEASEEGRSDPQVDQAHGGGFH